MLNFNQLRAFYEVARSLNFSVAAENLYVSQPAVTKQIKLFESAWNLKLFHKRRGKLYLTEEGKKIFVYAARIFELERQLEDAISGIQNLKQGSLRIGTTKTYARHLMPLLLGPFQKAFPDIIIELDEGSSLDMERSVLELRNSLAIVARVEENPDILFTPFMLEEVVLIMAPGYHLTEYDAIPFRALDREPIVMKEVGSGTRKLVEQFARRERINLNIIAQTSNMDFIKQLVSQGKGISFLVRTAVEEELSRGNLVSVPLEGEKLVLDICIARLADYELPLAAKRFLEYLLSITPPEGLPLGVVSFAKNLPIGT